MFVYHITRGQVFAEESNGCLAKFLVHVRYYIKTVLDLKEKAIIFLYRYKHNYSDIEPETSSR